MSLRRTGLVAILGGALCTAGCGERGRAPTPPPLPNPEGLWGGALRGGDAQVIESILSANPEAVDERRDGRTPLHWALLQTYIGDDVIRILLANGADISARDGNGDTPLHLAVDGSSLWDHQGTTVRLLLESGADPNASDQYGWTPLHRAAKLGRLGATRALLESGANIHAKTSAAVTFKVGVVDEAGHPTRESVITIPAGTTPVAVAKAVEKATRWMGMGIAVGGGPVIVIPDPEREEMLEVISLLTSVAKSGRPQSSGKPAQ